MLPRALLAAILIAFTSAAVALPPNPYDPLAVPAHITIRHIDLDARDAARSRTIPVRVYLPAAVAPAPVVLFSHGLGGSRTTCPYLGEHWAARGYVAVFMQHPGSDTSVWQGKPIGERYGDLKGAASAQNFLLRAKDVPAVLDQLAVWNRDASSPLHGRLDLTRVGMSGHSFGAVTTQAVSGESFGLAGQRLTDKRIKAAIAFSPSSPKGRAGERAFGSVAIPWMLMTGTRDVSPIGDQSAESRQAVYPALPPGSKYEVVLFDAEHSAFTEGALPGDRARRNPNHHRAILALSTAFWDAYVRGDASARQWLDGEGPKRIIEAKDRWQRK